MQKKIAVIVAALLFLPNLFNIDINPFPHYNGKEKFDPRLSCIDNIGKLEAYTDSIAAAKKISATGYAYMELLESVTENRFYHGFSHFTLSENWIAAVAGKCLKEDYACKVQPGKIMQHANAACSQQALVMMAILRDKKIPYRSVGFPHHYAMEVWVEKNWYFFDANMEPTINKEERMAVNWKHHNDSLKKYYDTGRFTDLDYKFGTGLTATTGKINEVPARNARIFDFITGVISKTAWCFPLLFVYWRQRFSRRLWPVRKNDPTFSLAG